MKKSIFLYLIASGVFAASVSAQSTQEEAAAATSTFLAVLLGANEVPAAEPRAVGFAEVTLDPAAGTVTFSLTAPDLVGIFAAHIHRGAAGFPGPVVVPLNAPFTNGYSFGTTTGVAAGLMSEILGNPANFYVNIHDSAFTGGAIRGQLTPAPGTSVNACLPDQTTLCLNQGRFKVQVSFQTSTIPAGVGNAIPLTGDTGSFWFFSPDNLELMIKVLDGRVINGKFWFFLGALSDVAYTVTVTDLTTSTVKTYSAAQGHQTALNDTSAF